MSRPRERSAGATGELPVIDMSHGTADPAWPADPFWRDKIRIALEAHELGRALRAGRPASLRR